MPSVTETRISLVMKPPAKESYADDASTSSDSEVQKATIPMQEKEINAVKEAGKTKKAAVKTYEKEAEDQSDVGSCTPATNKCL